MDNLKSIKKIRFVLTDYCNYQCKFCHNEGASTKNTKFLNKDSIFLLTKAAKDLKIKKITLTGGEPLLHPEINDITTTIKKIYPNVSLGMATNGMLFNEDNFSVVIKGIDRLRLNFQSLNNITLKSICGNSANINKSFKIIKDAKKLNPNLNICLNYVLTKYNKDSLFDVVKFALKNNLDVKILEYMAIDKKIYVDIKYAKDFLKSLNPIEQFKDYQDDDIYIYKKSTSRIRLCYSFCNGFRCKSCRECGEIRLTSSSTLKHCFYNKVKDLEIKNDLLKQDIKSIKNKIISIDKIKGKLI